MHTSISFKCLHLKKHLYSPCDCFSINDLLIAGLVSNTSLATECSTAVPCLNKVLKTATGISLHLTNLRGGATHQFRKAWERNALHTVAWEDLHQAQTINAAAHLMQTLELSKEASHRSLA